MSYSKRFFEQGYCFYILEQVSVSNKMEIAEEHAAEDRRKFMVRQYCDRCDHRFWREIGGSCVAENFSFREHEYPNYDPARG